jgi:hypothetical protein
VSDKDKEFEAWWETDGAPMEKLLGKPSRKFMASLTWDARQPEIDKLKAKRDKLKELLKETVKIARENISIGRRVSGMPGPDETNNNRLAEIEKEMMV